MSTQPVDSTRWEDRWSEGKTGWDQGGPHRALVKLLDSAQAGELGIPTHGTALVPGCGQGYDVRALALYGLDTVGLDISPTGVQSAKRWLDGQSPQARGKTSVIVQDFFAYSPQSGYDVILDYTFLCALPPDFRPMWSEQIPKLAASDCRLITIMFPLPSDTRPPKEGGPPFQLSKEIYHRLLDQHWELLHMEDIEPLHMRQGGPMGGEAIAVWRKRS